MQKYGSKKDIKQILARMKLRIDMSSDGSEPDDNYKQGDQAGSHNFHSKVSFETVCYTIFLIYNFHIN